MYRFKSSRIWLSPNLSKLQLYQNSCCKSIKMHIVSKDEKGNKPVLVLKAWGEGEWHEYSLENRRQSPYICNSNYFLMIKQTNKKHCILVYCRFSSLFSSTQLKILWFQVVNFESTGEKTLILPEKKHNNISFLKVLWKQLLIIY